jgi:hypothetical protein
MMTFPDLAFASSDRLVLFTDRLRLAVAAYLASAGIRITKEPNVKLSVTKRA